MPRPTLTTLQAAVDDASQFGPGACLVLLKANAGYSAIVLSRQFYSDHLFRRLHHNAPDPISAADMAAEDVRHGPGKRRRKERGPRP